MPNTARWAATLTLTASAVCGLLTGSALASPQGAAAGLHAPSALVLTVGHGPSVATAAPERAVTLTCAPTPSGTPPAPAEACVELRANGGDFDALADRGGAACNSSGSAVFSF